MTHKVKKGFVVTQWDRGEWAWSNVNPVYKDKKTVEKRITKLNKKYPKLKFKPLKVEYTEG